MGGETNFRVNFGTSENCPISEALTRALLIGSGIFWNGIPEKCPDPAIQSPDPDTVYGWYFLG